MVVLKCRVLKSAGNQFTIFSLNKSSFLKLDGRSVIIICFIYLLNSKLISCIKKILILSDFLFLLVQSFEVVQTSQGKFDTICFVRCIDREFKIGRGKDLNDDILRFGISFKENNFKIINNHLKNVAFP